MKKRTILAQLATAQALRAASSEFSCALLKELHATKDDINAYASKLAATQARLAET